MAKKTFFVTGTDTGVGKTSVSAALLVAARKQGLRTIAVKPVASGCERTPEGLRNSDALALQGAMTEKLVYEQVNPVSLEPAIAPHVAARQAGVQLSVSRLAGFCRGVMMRPAELCLIEGAGGWRVPLNQRESFAGVPRELGVDVILVVALRLGAINHALLTAEAIRHDGLRVAGWVGNRPDSMPMDEEQDTVEFLQQHIEAPCLGLLPWVGNADPELLSRNLDLSPLRLSG